LRQPSSLARKSRGSTSWKERNDTTQTRRTLPDFANEAEEAQWWFDNQDMIARDFLEAAANGTLKRGTAKRRALEAGATVQLDPADILQSADSR
jgi:hypothetical protein